MKVPKTDYTKTKFMYYGMSPLKWCECITDTRRQLREGRQFIT